LGLLFPESDRGGGGESPVNAGTRKIPKKKAAQKEKVMDSSRTKRGNYHTTKQTRAEKKKWTPPQDASPGQGEWGKCGAKTQKRH